MDHDSEQVDKKMKSPGFPELRIGTCQSNHIMWLNESA